MNVAPKPKLLYLVRITGVLVLALCGLHSHAVAEERSYPSKPVRWIVPYPPGSASDVIARAFAGKLQEKWHQSVIVENRPGAATNIGSEVALRSPADGHTLFLSTATAVTNPFLFDRLSYDPARDFVPVSLLARSVLALFVPSASPLLTFSDIALHHRNHPGQLAYGAPGIGSMGHLAGQQLIAVTKTPLVFVPYVGSAQIATDLAGGHLPLAIGNLFVHMPQVRSGRIRVLLVLGTMREPALPDVPSVTEIGFPELVAEGFAGVSVAAGTPRDIVQKLSVDLQEIGKMPDIVRLLEEPGTRIVASSSDEYVRFLQAEAVRWKKVIREHKIRVE